MSGRFSYAEMADELAKLVQSKSLWIATFSSGKDKRPDSEITLRTRERAVLEQAEADYRRAARKEA